MDKCSRPWWKFWENPHDYGSAIWEGPGKTIPGGGGWTYRQCSQCGETTKRHYFNS